MKAKRTLGQRFWQGITKRVSGAGALLAKVWAHKQGKVGLIMVSFLVLVAIFAPSIAPYDPYDVSQRAAKGLPPSREHLLGTTINTGQDIFSMLIYGTRVSLIVGVTSGACIAFVGSILGVAAGYLGGAVDTLLMRLVDIMLVIPTLPLVIVLTNVLGRDFWIIILIFVALGWTGLARTIRSLVLVLKNSNYVKAAELAGASRWHIMTRHILPGTSHLLIMSTALSSAGIMVAEAGLSFLGLGDPTAISWGKMLAEAQSGGALLFGAWWWILAPGLGIFLAVFGFMRLGLVLEEIANPRMKRTSSVYKLFKSLDSSYVEEVFRSMDDYQKIGAAEVASGGGQHYGTGLEA
jgi:peptide/nickel transport system permease protein